MEGWEIVFRAQGMGEAQVIKGYLESEGIPVDLDYESAGKVYGITVDGLGEVRIQVPAEYLELASRLIANRIGGLKPAKNDRPLTDSDPAAA